MLHIKDVIWMFCFSLLASLYNRLSKNIYYSVRFSYKKNKSVLRPFTNVNQFLEASPESFYLYITFVLSTPLYYPLHCPFNPLTFLSQCSVS